MYRVSTYAHTHTANTTHRLTGKNAIRGFCKLSLGGNHSTARQPLRTRTAPLSPQPVWNEAFTLQNVRLDEQAELKVGRGCAVLCCAVLKLVKCCVLAIVPPMRLCPHPCLIFAFRCSCCPPASRTMPSWTTLASVCWRRRRRLTQWRAVLTGRSSCSSTGESLWAPLWARTGMRVAALQPACSLLLGGIDVSCASYSFC